MSSGIAGAGENDEQDFKIVLADKRFLYGAADVPDVDRSQLKKEMLEIMQTHGMAPAYEAACAELGWEVDAALLEGMAKAGEARLAELDAKVKDAEENLGEAEVRDALTERAEHLAAAGSREAAAAAYEAAEAKTAGVGQKLDLALSVLRLDIAGARWHDVQRGVDHAHALLERGGDWERKNKLKVYEAVLLVATRQFRRAAELFLAALPTFTATELMPYESCVFYAVALAVLALDRPTLKDKVVESPEVLSVVDTVPHLRALGASLHGCEYRAFFSALSSLAQRALRADRYLAPHFRHYMREVRVRAYLQFLESYRSVTLASMADAFGVSPAFLDAELADFIVAGRLPAKVDRVAGVVETNRPDAKTALYESSIRQGDVLLNRLQKLAKVTDIE